MVNRDCKYGFYNPAPIKWAAARLVACSNDVGGVGWKRYGMLLAEYGGPQHTLEAIAHGAYQQAGVNRRRPSRC